MSVLPASCQQCEAVRTVRCRTLFVSAAIQNHVILFGGPLPQEELMAEEIHKCSQLSNEMSKLSGWLNFKLHESCFTLIAPGSMTSIFLLMSPCQQHGFEG